MATFKLSNTRTIFTNTPEQKIWNFIGSFENEHFVRAFAKGRITRKFYGFDFASLNEKKKGFDVERLEPIEINDLDKVVDEVSGNAKQTRDFYLASKQLPLLSRPLLLHYSFEKLANILILLTYKITDDTYSHGLTFYRNKPINVKRKGLFQRFHDCYSLDPGIYCEGRAFNFENVLNAGQIDSYYLFERMRDDNIDSNSIVEENTKKAIVLEELDREFLFIFGLSTLARYRVNEWNETIAGKTSETILRIQEYLDSIQSFFPNLILNILYGEKLLFYQPARYA